MSASPSSISARKSSSAPVLDRESSVFPRQQALQHDGQLRLRRDPFEVAPGQGRRHLELLRERHRDARVLALHVGERQVGRDPEAEARVPLADAEVRGVDRQRERRVARLASLGDVVERALAEQPTPKRRDVRAQGHLVARTALEVAPDVRLHQRGRPLEVFRDVDRLAQGDRNLSRALAAISRSPPYARRRGASSSGSQRVSATSTRISPAIDPRRPRPARSRKKLTILNTRVPSRRVYVYFTSPSFSTSRPVTPVSSSVSRTAVSAGVSPGSRFPFGSAQVPSGFPCGRIAATIVRPRIRRRSTAPEENSRSIPRVVSGLRSAAPPRRMSWHSPSESAENKSHRRQLYEPEAAW